MLLLGIHDGHNASACIYGDGRILAAQQEERLTRRKNQAGFPRSAIDAVLHIAGVTLRELDAVVFAGKLLSSVPDRTKEKLNYRRNADFAGILKAAAKASPMDSARRTWINRGRTADVRELGFNGRVEFVDHHACHAAASYYGFGRWDKEVLVLTMDGGGDRVSATVNIGKDGRFKRLATVPEMASLGLIWATVTVMLGMAPNEHEYKIMGLAPYASAKASERVAKRFEQMFSTAEDGLTWKLRSGVPAANRCYRYIRDIVEFERFDAVAGGLQLFSERFVKGWVRSCIRHTGIRDVALGGGVFMNVKVNKAIMELDELRELFVFPSCGDENNPVGACFLTAARAGESVQPLSDVYWGAEHPSEVIAKAVESYRFGAAVTIRRIPMIEESIAKLLAQGFIVARFRGREEFGARSLGNRALLAPARAHDSVRRLNYAIKERDFWMPFALSMLAERASEYINNPKGLAAPYMILAFDTSVSGRDLVAGIHPHDFTVRPQVVREQDNVQFYHLLRAYEALTGDGAVVNTSFNLHGEPLVSSPEDALRVFNASGLEHLAIGDILVSKIGCQSLHDRATLSAGG